MSSPKPRKPRPAKVAPKAPAKKHAKPQPATVEAPEPELEPSKVPSPEPEQPAKVEPKAPEPAKVEPKTEPAPEVLQPPAVEVEPTRESQQRIFDAFSGGVDDPSPGGEVDLEDGEAEVDGRRVKVEVLDPEEPESEGEREAKEATGEAPKAKRRKSKAGKTIPSEEQYLAHARALVKFADLLSLWLTETAIRPHIKAGRVDKAEFQAWYDEQELSDADVELVAQPAAELLEQEEAEISPESRLFFAAAMVFGPRVKDAAGMWFQAKQDERDQAEAKAAAAAKAAAKEKAEAEAQAAEAGRRAI